MLKNQKGITLIALIITIIVMLILVGVTVNVALNGGLFEKGEKAAYQTQASTVKEQLEMAKAVAIANSDGKLLDDYSGITVEKLEGLDAKTIDDYKDKIVVAKNGDICYNPANVTGQEKVWLEEIGISEYVNSDGDNPGGAEQNYQCFRRIDDGIETVLFVDYENKLLREYTGLEGQVLTTPKEDVIPFEYIQHTTPFYVIEDGVNTDIGTGAIKFIYSTVDTFLKNDKLYIDVVEGSEATAHSLIPNFDITRLVEE